MKRSGKNTEDTKDAKERTKRRTQRERPEGLGSVLVVSHRLQPFCFYIHVYRDVGAAGAGRGAVPMFFAGCDHDGVTRLEVERRRTRLLNADVSVDNQQPLRSRVCVPMCASAFGELDSIHMHGRARVVT